MKINFIVCEDNIKTRKTLCDWLETYIDNEKVQLLLETAKPEEVLRLLKSTEGVVICLLDINLNESINGVALAERIKNTNIHTKIIFITAYAEWAVESLNRNIEPFAYLTKPLDRQTFDWHMKRLLKKVREAYESQLYDYGVQYIKLEAYGRSHYKRVDSITHVETYHKEGYVMVHTLKGEKIVHKSRLNDMLNNLNQLLPETFLQCYKSILVNPHYIEVIDRKKGEILLRNGNRLFISREKRIHEEIEKRITRDTYA